MQTARVRKIPHNIFPYTICRDLYFCAEWFEARSVVRFVNIGGIVDHYCLI